MLSEPDVRQDAGSDQDAVIPDDVIFGSSLAMSAVRELVDKLAATTAPVLFTGETGTGKEVLARYLHRKSAWRDAPFWKLGCPLFSFSGSLGEHDRISEAIIDVVSTGKSRITGQPAPLRGTLLFDDVSFLDMVMQVRLLEKLGENLLLPVRLPDGRLLELRVLFTTNRRLDALVRHGQFLRELYHLIRVFTVELPPLRHRREDLPQLTSYFLQLFNQRIGSPRLPPSPAAFQRMREYDWPGNVRELENLIARYVVQGSEEALIKNLSRGGGSSFSSGVLSRRS